MTGVESVATNLAQKLVDGAIKEAQYLCCFNSNFQNFETEKNRLSAKRWEVQKDIDDAKKRNEILIEDGVKQWTDEVDSLIKEDYKRKKKWLYGWCPNCIWQYQKSKKLARMAQEASNLVNRCGFNRVARPAELPGIKYHTSQDFIDFESRKSKLKELVMALEDENYYMIGLQGMGGTGKTTLATQVGKQVEESKTFQKVIFTIVSTPPNIKKIQLDIARQLGFPLEEKKEAEHSELLWSKISENKEKILIILDDVWEKLNLKDIGIPSSNEHRECCVLITTRNSNVCGAMGCQRMIHLETLNGKDALNLFLMHAISNNNSFSSDLERMALDIVRKCGGLPVVIVALANTLKHWPIDEWKLALTTIRNSEALDDVDEDLTEVYNCLSLSYKNLKNEKAKKLFLLCSLFPENYEIPTNLFIRLGIGAGIFGDVDKYYKSKRQALGVKNELIASSLLKVEKDCLKLDDLVRDMALRIAKEDIQVIMDSIITSKVNKRFLFWNTDDFPDQFDGTKLEILFLWINGKVLEKNPDAFFARMTMLKVMFLLCKYEKKHLSPLLSQSLLSLKNIRTLILNGWKLDDLSILRNLQSLETFELENCLINELPIEIRELNKLRLLGLRKCRIERHNPFEVIRKCSQLEELYFVENNNVEDWNAENDRENINEVAHDTSPFELQMYFIACSGLDYFKGVDNGLLKCFNTKHIRHLISDAMFRHLMGRAEVLEFGEIREKGWKSLIPNIVPIKDGSLNELMKLYLYYLDDLECLVHTSIDYDVTVLSKLVELHLYHVNMKELCQGPMPSNFLKQLQILIIRDCGKLHNIFFDGNLNLPYLKTLELHNCPMFQPSLFQPYFAQNLAQLEELIIVNCERLKSIITYESSNKEIGIVEKQNGYGILFPKLKSLRIETCEELEWISPLLFAGDLSSLEAIVIRKCMKLEYIFGEYRDEGHILKQEIMLPSLIEMRLDEAPSLISILRECNKCMQRPSLVVKDDSKKRQANYKAHAFSWAQGCLCLPTTTGIVVSNHALQHHKNSQELCATECLLIEPLKLQNIREMDLYNCSKLKSLFSISIATTLLLEKLKISWCDELKQIISNEGKDRGHINYSSIFPKLEEIIIRNCRKLEFLFPSTFSRGLQKLKSIDIEGAYGLKYVFGGYNHENNDVPIDLPALEMLSLMRVPKIISMCTKNYYVVWPSLQNITLMSWSELIERPFPELMVCLQGRQLNLERGYQELIRRPCSNLIACLQGRQQKLDIGEEVKKMIMDMQNLITLEVGNHEKIEEIFNVEGIESEGLVTLSLQSMSLKYLRNLTHIYKDPNNILSLHNLEVLVIRGCDKLRAILSTSTLKSLPRLTYLEVIDCRDLVHIIEDDCERRSDDRCHQLCFPMLEQIRIYHCYKLRSLFSISTSGMLPKLETLEIEAASMLEEVFSCQHTQVMVMENVLPNLSYLRLIDLPKLRTICRGIHFQFVPNFEVFYCPRFGENEVASKELQSTHSDIDLDSENQGAREELQSKDSTTGEVMPHMGEAKKEQEIETQQLTIALPNFIEEATKEVIDEDPISKISAKSTKETLMEIEAKDHSPALDKQASKTLVVKSQLRGTSLHELEDEHIRTEIVAQLQHQDLGETKTTIEALHKNNIQFDDDSIDAILKERVQEGPTSEDIIVSTMLVDLAPTNSSICEETKKDVGKAALALKLPIRKTSLDFELANQQPNTKQNLQDQLTLGEAKSKEDIFVSINGIAEQGFQEHDVSKEAIIGIQSKNDGSLKQSRVPLDNSIAKEFAQITQCIKETTKQSCQKNYAIEDALKEIQLASSDSMKKSTRPFVNLSEKDSMLSAKEASKEIVENVSATRMSPIVTPFELEFKRTNTTKETRDAKSQERPKLDKTTKADLSNTNPSLHHGTTGPSSPMLGIGEILELVELKEGEAALLAKALELYPQLRLSREQRTHPIIAFSYKVLIDILVMLATKTPYTITTSDKLTLEANLGAATFLGFDKDWVESIQAKVFGVNMTDVLVMTELETLVIEAELETCDIALEQIQKQRKEAKEQLVVIQDKYREIISAKDIPFGF